MPFWTSLVHSSPRVAGLRERALASYEAGLATFPQDFPSTHAYEEHEKRREVEDRGYWERRPPAKRPNYQKLGTENPWNLDFGEIFGVGRTPIEVQEKGKGKEKAVEEDPIRGGIEPFLVPFKVLGSLTSLISKNRPSATPPTLQKGKLHVVEKLERDLHEAWTTSGSGTIPRTSILRGALVRVRIDPCVRGVPEDCGIVYELSDSEVEKVRAKMDSAKKKSDRILATGEGEGAEDVSHRLSRFFWTSRLLTWIALF